MARYLTDLGIADYKILQDDEDYAFSQDSVLLANLAKLKSSDCVLDLGCGSGILSILACIKKGVKSAVGIELREELAALAKENAKLNALPFEVICGDVKNVRGIIKAESFDKVLCNPPYFSDANKCASLSDAQKSSENDDIVHNSSDKDGKDGRRIARQESTATLENFISAAAFSLKFGGSLWIVMKIARLQELMTSLNKFSFAAKEIIFVYPKLSSGIDTVIVSAKKGGKAGLVAKTFIAMNEDGTFSKEYNALYKE